MQASNPAASEDMTSLWMKLQQQHAQEAAAGRQQAGTPQQQIAQSLGMLRPGQPGGLQGGIGGLASGIPSQLPGTMRTSQASQAENDFWQQLQGK
jgi:hypothetical protein